MEKDRVEICKIISEMLDNPNKYGIYPTSTAFNKLELYIKQQRAEAARRALVEYTHPEQDFPFIK